MPYYYKIHTGGFYTTDTSIEYDDPLLYCETCDDWDLAVGYYENDEEFFVDHPFEDPNFDWDEYYEIYGGNEGDLEDE